MARKTVTFKPKPTNNAEEIIDGISDSWVLGETILNKQQYQARSDKEDHYRFTIVIPKNLHKKIKKFCAVHEISMKEKITEILEKEFQ